MNSKDWQLHPTLAQDCHLLGKIGSCELLLHKNASLHWFILVPHTQVLDLLDLPAHDRDALLASATLVSNYLKQTLRYPRVNVGALGLVVPQLHLHLIGRREGDPCWPAPVWGNLDTVSGYSQDRIDVLRADLMTYLNAVTDQ